MARSDLWRPTFPELCRELNDRGVEYLVIGGQATILYGVPRTTFDVDILIKGTRENAEKLLEALSGIGFGTAREVAAEEILSHKIFLFMDQIRVDIFLELLGVGRYEDGIADSEMIQVRETRIPLLGLDRLILSKRATVRPQDRSDAEALEEIRRRKRV